VLISPSPKDYEAQLQKSIRQNGTLNTASSEATILNSPIDPSIPAPRKESAQANRARPRQNYGPLAKYMFMSDPGRDIEPVQIH
jgi:hypothetical protein